MRRFTRIGALCALILGVAALMPPVASAAPPSNDRFAEATVVSELPATFDLDLSEAGLEEGEPVPSCDPLGCTRSGTG